MPLESGTNLGSFGAAGAVCTKLWPSSATLASVAAAAWDQTGSGTSSASGSLGVQPDTPDGPGSDGEEPRSTGESESAKVQRCVERAERA